MGVPDETEVKTGKTGSFSLAAHTGVLSKPVGWWGGPSEKGIGH